MARERCAFCRNQPVANGAAWVDDTAPPYAPCPRCGVLREPGKRPKRPCPTCHEYVPVNNFPRHVRSHLPHVERLPMPLDEQLRIVALYERPRASFASVSAATFWSKTEVRRVLLAHGVELRKPGSAVLPRKISVADELQRTQLYGQGHSIEEVAAIVGRHRTAVHESLKRAGVKLRPSHVTLTSLRHRAASEARSAPAPAGSRARAPKPRSVPPRAAQPSPGSSS